MKKELKFIISITISIIIIAGIVSFTYNKVNIFVGVIFSAITILLCAKIYIKKEITPEKLFLYIAPMIMILFLIGIPSWKNPDESVHWFRIYDITQGHFITEKLDGIAVAELPKEVLKYHNYSSELDIKYSSFPELYENKINEEGETIYREMSTTAIYHPIQYMPQVIGSFIADIFTDRPFIMMYAARLANMIFSLIILYIAIKIIPYGKNILLLLTCLPVAAAGFASMSPDAMTISVSYLFISYILKLLYEKDKKINLKNKILLIIMSIVISLCKIVYLPLAGLILLLPKEKYNSRKEQIITCVLVIGIAIITNLYWLVFCSNYLVEYKEGSPLLQLTDLLNHPFEFMQKLFFTISMYAKSYLEGLFGYGVGADLHIVLYGLLPIIMFIMFLFLTIADKKLKNIFTTYQKVITALIVLAISGLIFTSIYIQWTPVNSDVILGVQGRYFLPIIPLISILIANSLKIKSEYDENKITKILRNNNFNNICICYFNSNNK